jgi:hypothetical protein
MESLARQYSGQAGFYILYVREAHPGGNYPAHQSLSEKLQHAKDLQRLDHVAARTILIDDVEGTMHKDYGARPNSVYVIGKDGIISYRADWSEPDQVKEQLERLLAKDGNAAALEAVSVANNFTPATPEILEEHLRVFRRAGLGAIVDFWFSSTALARGRMRNPRSEQRIPPRKDISQTLATSDSR